MDLKWSKEVSWSEAVLRITDGEKHQASLHIHSTSNCLLKTRLTNCKLTIKVIFFLKGTAS